MVKELDLTKVYEKVNGEKREKLSLFQRLLLEYNEKFNLTSITDEKEIYYKHFIDSAAGESLFKENASVVEVGSGAGFPSLVLKILREDLSFTLVESVGKKCEFLKAQTSVDTTIYSVAAVVSFRVLTTIPSLTISSTIPILPL